MKIIREEKLSDFQFWGVAADHADCLTSADLDVIEASFQDAFPNGMTSTQINHMFWHESDFIAEILGYTSFSQIMKKAIR